MSVSFAYLSNVSCSRKRKAMSGTNSTLSGLLCTPLAPVDMETRRTLGLESPHVVWEVYLEGSPDIKKGDVLVIASVEYQIHDVSPWTWPMGNQKFIKLVIEDLTNNAV
jgi:hypothetical protein